MMHWKQTGKGVGMGGASTTQLRKQVPGGCFAPDGACIT